MKGTQRHHEAGALRDEIIQVCPHIRRLEPGRVQGWETRAGQGLGAMLPALAMEQGAVSQDHRQLLEAGATGNGFPTLAPFRLP